MGFHFITDMSKEKISPADDSAAPA